MEKLAAAGIPTGICCMPILPGLCDNDANLEAVVRWTADHGGSFVLASGLTLADQQRDYFFGVLGQRFPDLLALYQKTYLPGSYGLSGDWSQRIALRVRQLCEQYGIRDRMPRPVIPGEKRERNKRIVEALADQVYTMELKREPQQRIWAYRKAAWAIEDLEQDIYLIYRTMGIKGLQSIPDIGPRLAAAIEKLLLGGLQTV